MRFGRGAMAVVAIAFVTSGCASAEKLKVSGTVSAPGALVVNPEAGQVCKAGTGDEDISAGTSVTFKDDANRIIGTTILFTGHLRNVIFDSDTGRRANVGSGDCVFEIAGVRLPSRPFYVVAVAHRDGVTYSRGQIKAARNKIAITVD